MSLLSNSDFSNPKVTKTAWNIYDSLREYIPSNCGEKSSCTIVACYLLSKIAQGKESEANPLATEYMNTHIPLENWEKIKTIANSFSSEEFAIAAVLNGFETFSFDNGLTSPISIIKLAKKILDIQEKDSVVDICSGLGNFLISAEKDVPSAEYYGFDINPNCNLVSVLKNELLGLNIQFSLINAFDLIFDESIEKRTFNKIFSNYPFGLRMRHLGDGKHFPEKLVTRYPWFSSLSSGDWAFNSLLCDLLEEGGKAVVVMTNGSLWNTSDNASRKHFIETGLIEAVVGLPNAMFPGTGIATSLIIFSHGNDKVRFVDASRWAQSGRRMNVLSDDDVMTILEALKVDGTHSCQVTIEDILDNECNLNVERYLIGEPHFDNGKPFSSVVKRITRGAPCTAKELDEITSSEPTNMQYLMLANIKDGQIEEELPYLKVIDPKYNKYCLHKNNLILSKNGYPYKIAVASVKEGKKVLVNGNLYVIELDEDKANPYYIKAFFESESGIAALRRITVGTVMSNIGIESLKNLEIPVPSMKEQERIASKYLAKLDEIKILRMSLKKAEEELSNIFNEEASLG